MDVRLWFPKTPVDCESCASPNSGTAPPTRIHPCDNVTKPSPYLVDSKVGRAFGERQGTEPKLVDDLFSSSVNSRAAPPWTAITYHPHPCGMAHFAASMRVGC